ncbi:MAG TPA: hypothetical protein VFJ82_16455 [Longimicrobium sp.]|nr:hypothetical protein [Longimicrobium sp.]
MPTTIIIAGDAEQDLVKLAQALDQRYANGQATVLYYSEASQIAGSIQGTVFLVGHANVNQIGDLDADTLLTEAPWKELLGGAEMIYLAGCSTTDESQQIISGKGFFPTTLGKAVHQKYQKPVCATPAPLILTATGVLKLEITQASLSQGISDENQIWVCFR